MEFTPEIVGSFLVGALIGVIVTLLFKNKDEYSVTKEQLDASLDEFSRTLLDNFTETAYQQARHPIDQLDRQVENLTRALQHPTAQGKWGEEQLEELVRMAGLTENIHYTKQVGEQQGKPDMVIHLPKERVLLVDSKNTTKHYFAALNSDDPQEQEGYLKQHADALKTEIKNLSNRAYQDLYGNSLDYVVMFIPVESALTAACEENRQLFQDALNMKVLICTPTTLLSMLHTVMYSWSQHKVAENTEEIQRLGQDLYTKIQVFAEKKVTELRKKLTASAEAYNTMISYLDNSVIKSAKEMHDLGLTGKETDSPSSIDSNFRKSLYEEDDNPESDPNDS